MIYKCKKCGEYLSVYDVEFNKSLCGGKLEIENCVCSKHIIGEQRVHLLKGIWWHISQFLSYCIAPLLLIIGALLMVYNQDYTDESVGKIFYIIGAISAALGGLSLFPFALMHVLELNIDDGIYEAGSHYETSYNSSSRSFETKEVKDYGGGQGCFLMFLLAISFILWAIPVYFIREIKIAVKIKREISLEVKKAYLETKHLNKHYKIKGWLDYNKKRSKYEAEKNRIKSVYRFKSKEYVDAKLNKLSPPILIQKFENVKYIVFDLHDFIIGLPKIDDRNKGIIIYKERILYSTKNELENDLKLLLGSFALKKYLFEYEYHKNSKYAIK